MLRTIIFFLSLTFSALADEKTYKIPAPKLSIDAADKVVNWAKSHANKNSVQIDGKKIPDKVTPGKIQLKGDA